MVTCVHWLHELQFAYRQLMLHIHTGSTTVANHSIIWWPAGLSAHLQHTCITITYTVRHVARADDKSCFPAAATVRVEGRGTVRMDSLQYGDKVLSIDTATGQFVYRTVFLFGHKLPTGSFAFVNMGTDSGATLQLTANHFVPIRTPATGFKFGNHDSVSYKLARDIRVGDVVMVLAQNSTSAFTSASPANGTTGGAAVMPAMVTEVWESHETGLFNPYVRGADIIVDGVVASPHAVPWGLHNMLPASLLPFIPAVMEVLFVPIYGLTQVLGPQLSDWVAHDGMHLVDAGATHMSVFFSVVAAVSGVVPLAAWITVTAARKALRL